MKKFLNNRLSTEPDSDHRHIQHLKHDFQVYQLLQSSTDVQNNRQSYIDILNQVSFNNHHKRREIKLINNQLHKLVDRNKSTLRLSVQLGSNPRQNDLRDFQKKILEQEEVKCNLKAQSEEILKSINLLRGDVGRLLQKNQSTDVLEKKTSKVKLVAQDQFKKVNLALQKDHSEISERNNMQIRFNKKLKNICNSQNNILKKIQGEYTRLQKRKKVINQKINRMEGIMKVLNEREKTKQQTKIVNQRNRMHLEEIMNLLRIVNQIKSDNEDIVEKEDQEKEEEILQSHLSLKTQRFKSKIKQIQGQISEYISKLVEQIQKAESFFKMTSESLQQNKNKFKQLEAQQTKYIQFLAGCRHDVISKQEKHFYEQKLTQFKRVSSLILIIWQFIQNNNNVTILIDNQNNHDFSLSKKQQLPSRFYRRSEQFAKKSSLMSEQNNYSNKILALLLYLSGNGEQVNLESDYLMKSMEMTIVMWLRGFKNILQSHQSHKQTYEHSDKLKKARSMQGQKFKSTIQLLQQTQKQDNPRIHRTSLCQQEQDKLKTMLELIIPKKSFITSQQYQQPQHKQHRTEGNDDNYKPSRLKVLQKADHDYYKMLKNVLQIEKENIKKNYDFNKKFNRAKFTQKNIIQEEKRFQSKFALQFIQKNDKIDRNFVQSRKTIMSKESSRQKTFRKRRQHHYLTISNFKVDRVQDLNSSRKQSAKKPKQSFFNPQKLQRKSKLVNRQSQQGSNVKESRISTRSVKRGLIFFAENTINQQY